MDLDTEVDLRLTLMRYPADARVTYEPLIGYTLSIATGRGYEHIDLPEVVGKRVLEIIAPRYL